MFATCLLCEGGGGGASSGDKDATIAATAGDIKEKLPGLLDKVNVLPDFQKHVEYIKENNFQNIEIKETLERYWIIKENILRPKNEMVGHTGFIVSGRFIL